MDCLNSIETLRNVTRTLSNLCSVKPAPNNKYGKEIIEPLNEMLKLAVVKYYKIMHVDLVFLLIIVILMIYV